MSSCELEPIVAAGLGAEKKAWDAELGPEKAEQLAPEARLALRFRFFRLTTAALLFIGVTGGLIVIHERAVAAVPQSDVFVDGSDNFGLLEYNEITRPYAMGECVGSVLGATLWTANIGLILRSTAYDCPVGQRFQEIYDDVFPWYPNGTLKKELISRRLGRSASDDDDVEPKTHQEFLQQVMQIRASAVREGEEPVEHRVARKRMSFARRIAHEPLPGDANETTKKLFQEFLRQVKSDLQAICARDILEFISASSVVATWAQVAERSCSTGQQVRGSYDCGTAVSGIVNKFHRMARFGAQMEERCPRRSFDFDPNAPEPDASYDCEGRMEGVGWEVSTIGSKMEKAIAKCAPEPGSVDWNVGGCVTMSLSAAAYLGASTISILAGAQNDCRNLTEADILRAISIAKEEDEDAKEEKLQELANSRDGRFIACARDITAAIRTMGLASMQASKGAGFCGKMNTQCSTDVASSLTAFVAAAESAILFALECRLKPFPSSSDFQRRDIRCTAWSASVFKELDVGAALAIDAAESCRETRTAGAVCMSGIVKAMAAFGYFLERAALAGADCKTAGVASGRRGYACGQTLEQNGEAVLVASIAIGSAAVNCGLGLQEKSPTKSFGLNRRFWVPR